MSNQNPLLQDEVFHLTLGNPNPTSSKTKDGAVYRASFELTREEWDWFMEADCKGMVIDCACRTGGQSPADTVTTPPATESYGEFAKKLKLSGFFMRPDVWKACGTDAELLAWCKTQKCLARQQGGCEGDIVAAHVRRIASGAGTGTKPKYSAIPMCNHHHQKQHNQGEEALGGKDLFDIWRVEAVGQWAWDAFKATHGAASMRDIPPRDVLVWATNRNLAHHLPVCFRQ